MMIIQRNKTTNVTEAKLTIAEHIAELRNRLLTIAVFFICSSLIGYYFNSYLITIFTAPLNQHLFFTAPTGAFEFAIHIAILCGFFLTAPLIVFQILEFLKPIFPEKISRISYFIIIAATLFMIIGLLCAYFIFIPLTLRFLLGFNSNKIQSLITTQEYISFVTFYLISFALIFQLPLIILCINFLYEISLKFLMSQQRIVIVISFVLAAILTPTIDIFNQFIVAIPIILLYEVSIILLWLYKKYAA